MQFLAFFLLNTVLHLKILLLKNQLAYGDFSPFPISNWQAFESFFYAWKEIGFGINRSVGHTQPLIQGFILSILGNNSLLSQKLFILAIPLISFLSFRYYVKKIYKKRSDFASFTASVFYAYSPIFMLEFIGGTIYSTILAFALFPLLYGLTEDVLETGSIKKIVLTGLLLGTICSFNSQIIIIYSVALIVPFLVRSFLNLKLSFFAFSRLFASVLVAFLVDPIFFLSNFKIISTTNSLGQQTNFARSFSIFLNDIRYTYSWSSMTNTLRMGGNYATGMNYTENTVWTISFFCLLLLIIIFASYSLLKDSSTKRRLFIITTFLNFLFLVSFIYLTSRGFTFQVFKAAPTLFLFRNPAKLTFLTTFFFSILLFCSINWLNRIRHVRKWRLYLLNSFVILIVAIYIWPVFTRDGGLSLTRKDYTIPEHYSKILNILQKDNLGEYHNLWLPASYESTSIKLVWLDSRKIEAQIGIGQFSDNYYVAQISNAINYFILNNQTQDLQWLLNMSQVRNVILLKDGVKKLKTSSFYGVNYIDKGSSDISKSLNFMPIVYEDRDVAVYRNNFTYPSIYSPVTITKSTTDFQSSISRVKETKSKDLTAFYLQSQNQTKNDIKINTPSTPQIRYQKMNATYYRIKVDNAKGKFPLIFNSTYDDGWTVISGGRSYDTKHFLVNGFANGWLLNTEEICANNGSCTNNKTDGYDLDLALYFKPQDNLLLSLYISTFTIFTSLLLIIFLK